MAWGAMRLVGLADKTEQGYRLICIAAVQQARGQGPRALDLLDEEPGSVPLPGSSGIVESGVSRRVVAMQQFRDSFAVTVGVLAYIH